MSRKADEAGGVSKSSGAKTEPKGGGLPHTYYGNSQACDTDRFNKEGTKGGGETRRGK